MNEKTRTFRIMVAAVIVKEKTVLLLQRREGEEIYPGIWELPSGKREFNESSIEALMREVKEETGLEVEVDRPISVFEYLVETSSELRDTTQINFLVYPINREQEVKINQREHQKARWFTEKELLSLSDITEATRNCALLALRS